MKKVYQKGIKGENFVREFLYNNKKKFKIVDVAQLDTLLRLYDGSWLHIEIKTQEPFVKGKNIKFDGHGLPTWQVRKYMKLYKEKEIRTMLVVVDIQDKILYKSYLDELENGTHKDTSGNKNRRIYPLSNFDIWKEDISNMIEYKKNFIEKIKSND